MGQADRIKTVWFISKYVSTPSSFQAPRNFCLMKNLSKLGLNSIIITSDSNHLAEPPEIYGSSKLEVIDGVSILWLRTLKYVKTNSVKRILSWFDFEWQLFKYPKKKLAKPDAIICSSLSILTIINCLMLKHRYKCTLVFEVRDIWPLTLVEEGGYSPSNPLIIFLGFIEKIGYKFSSIIVGTMPNLGEHVENILGIKKQVHCIPMGYDSFHINEVKELPNEYIEKYIPKDKFTVTHCGSIGIANSLETLFDCADKMSEITGIHFLVVGEGDLKKYYQTKYSHLCNITFAPKVPKNMVQSILAKSDIVYFSVPISKVWLYGQSLNKVIDYMISGKPIIASYNGYQSMINEANSGLILEAGNSLILKDMLLEYSQKTSEELKEIGLRGKKWVLENRSYEDLALNYKQILFPNRTF